MVAPASEFFPLIILIYEAHLNENIFLRNAILHHVKNVTKFLTHKNEHEQFKKVHSMYRLESGTLTIR